VAIGEFIIDEDH